MPTIRSKLARDHLRNVYNHRVERRITPYLRTCFPPLRGERFEAPVPQGRGEWSIIHDPRHDVSAPSPELVRLVIDAAVRASSISLDDLSSRATREWEQVELNAWPGQHYRLLAAIVDEINAVNIVEIGTFTGASALTFLSRESVKAVTTFDVSPWDSFEHTLLNAKDFDLGLSQVLADLSEPAVFRAHAKTLQSADLIFVDGPKDGRFEAAFLEHLVALDRPHEQILVLDDIRVMSMLDNWQLLPLTKIDATSFGHWSGTGVALLPASQAARQ